MKRWLGFLGLAGLVLVSCEFDASTRWIPPPPPPIVPPACHQDEQRCSLDVLQRCEADEFGEVSWQVADHCGSKGQVCATSLLKCTPCLPDALGCQDKQVIRCDPDGAVSEIVETCDSETGFACRGGACLHLCKEATTVRSNLGCEYWAVDLDNAMIDDTKNAAAQQFAVVVSNPHHDVPARVRITQDDAAPGEDHAPRLMAEAIIAPLNLRVFKLGPREVDGSAEGTFNTGTHTALTRHGYKIESDFPVVSYQFNPLENVSVFSNDASLLKSREALTYSNAGTLALSYVVASWPQTIAITSDPNTNFSAAHPINLRSFLTVVGTTDETLIRIKPTADVVVGGPVAATRAGDPIEMTLDAFDVLNLETADFLADFTGTTIEASQPIAVFVGGEASDAPDFTTLIERRCCADHLEEQADPIRTAGKSFSLVRSPSRSAVVQAAGGDIGVVNTPEYFRFVAVTDEPTVIHTSLAPPNDAFTLFSVGDMHQVAAMQDFTATSSEPIHVVQVTASQDAAGVPRGLPGGDPSLIVVPPTEQFRNSYVFLTPDKYAFDFVMIAAPVGVAVTLDNTVLSQQHCEISPGDGLTKETRDDPLEWLAYRCQLSFATVNPDTGEILEGVQNDGVHRLSAPFPVGVTVFGFDAYVSYAYAAGTNLKDIAPPK
jgi:hypothetical protein